MKLDGFAIDFLLKCAATIGLGIALILFYFCLIDESILVWVIGIVVTILSANTTYSTYKLAKLRGKR